VVTVAAPTLQVRGRVFEDFFLYSSLGLRNGVRLRYDALKKKDSFPQFISWSIKRWGQLVHHAFPPPRILRRAGERGTNLLDSAP
jgi:hypothetical protein